jgi:hypothetical protein
MSLPAVAGERSVTHTTRPPPTSDNLNDHACCTVVPVTHTQ